MLPAQHQNELPIGILKIPMDADLKLFDGQLLKYAADIESYKQRTAVPMINIVEKLKALGDGEPQFRASVLASREGLSRYLAGAEG
nr:hypothetical protein CIKMENKJ_00043 [Klebsiella pneumoniae subsp. pneumoniae]